MTETRAKLIEPGGRAPDFRLPSTVGQPVTLKDLCAEGPILLVFVAAECPTSCMTLERLEALAASAPQRRFLISIHQDPPDVAARTMRRSHASYLALSEAAPHSTSEAFGLATVPTAILVGPDGRVLRVIEGWDVEAYREAAALLDVPPEGLSTEPPVSKPGCGAKNTYDADVLRAAEQTGFDLQEDLFERGWTDGLPVVPPTRERVERMLGGSDPTLSLGPVPPGMGEATLERLASCAVLAGCHPTYFPVVRAAAEAMLDPAFNIHGQTNSTHSCGPVVIVNGPIRETIGLNGGINALGGWHRPNATIGRALRLLVGLTGGGAPGVLDRATLGQPGKISFCFAENEEASPWEPLSVTRGYAPGESVVTLYCGDAPMGVSNHYARDAESVLASLAQAGGAAFCPNAYPIGAETVFVVCPEHAASFEAAGWSKREVVERIFEESKRRVGDIRKGESLALLGNTSDDEIVSKWLTPDEIVIVVAGGAAGRFSAVLPPWVGFGLGSQMVSRPVAAA